MNAWHGDLVVGGKKNTIDDAINYPTKRNQATIRFLSTTLRLGTLLLEAYFSDSVSMSEPAFFAPPTDVEEGHPWTGTVIESSL